MTDLVSWFIASSGIPGAVHDLTILRQTADSLMWFLDRGNESEPYTLLADLGYLGIESILPSIIPFKKPPRGHLRLEQSLFNIEHAGQRVICERYYGRMKTKWRIMTSKWRGEKVEYSIFFSLCAALTNADLFWRPL